MSQHVDTAYARLVAEVLRTGTRKENRTGVDTLSTFAQHYTIDLQDGFPLLTTKSVSWKNIVVEMLWFLSGQTDIGILKRHGCKFWDAWADPVTGKVPSAYGNFWRHFPVHHPTEKRVTESFGRLPDDYERTEEPIGDFNDQIAWVLAEMKRNPMSRRMVVSAWAPGNAQTSKLPPCHSLFAFNVQNDTGTPGICHYGHNDGTVPVCTGYDDYDGRVAPHGQGIRRDETWCPKCRQILAEVNPSLKLMEFDKNDDPRRLCLHLTQRSADIALGVPYNIASYALLCHIASHLSGIPVGRFSHTLVDAHIYTSKPDGSMAEYDHVPGLREQINREPRQLPRLTISDSIKSLADIEALMKPDVSTDEVLRHFRLDGYEPHPAINFKVAV